MATLGNGEFVFAGIGNPSCGYADGAARIPQSLSDAITSNGSACAVSADGSMVAFGHTAGGYLDVYLTANWTRQTVTYSPGTTINGMAFSPDGSKLALAHATSPFVTIYDTATWAKISDPASLPAGVGNGVAWSPDGSQLAVAHNTSPYMTIYNVSDWSKRANPASLPTATGLSIAWSPDGSKVALGMSASPYIRIFNAPDLSNAASAPTPGGSANSLEYSPDGSKLAMGIGSAPYARIFNTTDWSAGVVPSLPAAVNGVSWSSNYELLLAVNAFPRLVIWNLTTATAENRSALGSNLSAVAALKYTPKTISGEILDINGNGVARTVRAYRRDTGQLVGSAVSNSTTGAYSIKTGYFGEHSVVMCDDGGGSIENDQILRTTPV